MKEIRSYSGTAYIFDSQCGMFPYSVRGPILDSGRRVVMSRTLLMTKRSYCEAMFNPATAEGTVAIFANDYMQQALMVPGSCDARRQI